MEGVHRAKMTHLWHSKLRSRIIMLQKFEMDILGIDPAILLRHTGVGCTVPIAVEEKSRSVYVTV